MNRHQIFQKSKRIVIKIGSGLISTDQGVNLTFIKKLASEIKRLKDEKKEIVLVSSGALACGMDVAGLTQRPKKIDEKQAIAAMGQPVLMHAYQKIFSGKGLIVGQVLLTREGLQNRKQFLNASHALQSLFQYGAVPIVNENDTVAIEELQVGDNDQLSSMVAHLIGADLLLILTDIDGLYDKDPKRFKNAQKIHTVGKVTDQIMALAGDSTTQKSTGGMTTKLKAAKQASLYGIKTWLLKGDDPKILRKLSKENLEGTLISCDEKKLSGRKYWIAVALKSKGSITIDLGAVSALTQKNKSLLASGIKKVEGSFKIGDAVVIKDPNGKEVAQGLCSYDSHDVEKIMGLKSSEIEKTLGYKYDDEVIHRDDLVIF